MSCQLPLVYTPMAAGSGMLNLSYSYDNNDGLAKTGTVNIAYRATTDDNIVATPNPPSPMAVLTGSITPVTVTFTTDDGNPASNFSVTSGLGTLPAGWSSASGSFACAAVSSAAACQLALTYAAPMAASSGTLSLSYQYNDNSGTLKTGSINLDYSAAP
jgi:hypothetical protein